MLATVAVRRLLILSAVATVLGFAGGVAAWVLLHLIAGITNAALFGRWSWATPRFADLHVGPRVVLAATAGAVVISLLAKWSPVIRGHGIPEAMEAVLTKQSRIAPRAALAKPLSAAIAIGTGAPFGAEGPIIVTGGSLGSLIGQILPVSPAERKILLASGAAAGMAATFGAPLASVVLAIELLLFEFSTRAFVPLVISAAIAGGMHSLLYGQGPLFHVPAHDYAGLRALPAFVVLGVGAGLLAVIITRGLFLIEGWYRRLPVGEFWHPVIGAVGFALVGLAVPRALGVGYDAIGDVLSTRLAAGTVAVLVLAKLVAWWVALGSGTSGGTLAPILLISAGYGSLFGTGLRQIFPHLHAGPGAFALVAMAATFGAATRATFTSIVFVFELTRDYQVILPLMVATVVADLLAGAVLRDSIMTEKLTRRGLKVHTDYEVDVLRTLRIRDIMTRQVKTLPDTATVADGRSLLAHGAHGAYPIVDEQGACVGIVARGDLLRAGDCDGDRLLDHASRQVVAVAPEDLAFAALEHIVEEGVDHIPVLEGGKLVGICTRTDILRARQRQLDYERAQPGWRRHAVDGVTPASRAAPNPDGTTAAGG